MSTTGSCFCGNISYTLKKAPEATVLCHCTTCHKLHGTAFSSNYGVSSSDIEFKGTPKIFTDNKTDVGKAATRAFCDQCGSSIYSKPGSDGYGDTIFVKSGTLDSWTDLPVQAQIYDESAASWARCSAAQKTFKGMFASEA